MSAIVLGEIIRNSVMAVLISNGVVSHDVDCARQSLCNIAIGLYSEQMVTTGVNDICVGDYTCQKLTTGSNNIIVGAGAQAPSPDTNDFLNIGGVFCASLRTGETLDCPRNDPRGDPKYLLK
jgi:hypothetical protein